VRNSTASTAVDRRKPVKVVKAVTTSLSHGDRCVLGIWASDLVAITGFAAFTAFHHPSSPALRAPLTSANHTWMGRGGRHRDAVGAVSVRSSTELGIVFRGPP
jgi:hypothetical protein